MSTQENVQVEHITFDSAPVLCKDGDRYFFRGTDTFFTINDRGFRSIRIRTISIIANVDYLKSVRNLTNSVVRSELNYAMSEIYADGAIATIVDGELISLLSVGELLR